ncbi:hypothetical protein [Mameliella sp.]|uniref:hypothetical protein n=1 Tax=Mameliella sp. TaxID=1924940 RepID=UPI003B514AE6
MPECPEPSFRYRRQGGLGAGDSTLSGGDLSDTFVFAPASVGTHVVTDFEGWDTLDLRGFGNADTADALDHSRQKGDHLVLQNAGVTVVLQDTSVEDLGPDTLLL